MAKRKVKGKFKKWIAAAKACKRVGKVGSKSKMACMKAHVRKH